MKKKKTISVILLFATAMIWGLAFVAQSEGIRSVGTYALSAARSYLAVMFLTVFSLVSDAVSSKKGVIPQYSLKEKSNRRTLIIGGVLCGIALTLGTVTQQTGLLYTSVGRSGFITALYILLVPIFSIALKKKVSPLVWVSVVIALGGMYLLCMSSGGGINKGDIFTFACTICFTFHIMCIDRFSPVTDGVKLSCVQFAVSALLSTIGMLIFEEVPSVEVLKSAAVPILYTGIMSSGVAFTLQIIAQKNVTPVLATLIMSLESVFAAIFGWIILKQKLDAWEIIGCVLVFAAIVLAQLPVPQRKRARQTQSN